MIRTHKAIITIDSIFETKCAKEFVLNSIHLTCAYSAINALLESNNDELISSHISTVISDIEKFIDNKNMLLKHIISKSANVDFDKIINYTVTEPEDYKLIIVATIIDD